MLARPPEPDRRSGRPPRPANPEAVARSRERWLEAAVDWADAGLAAEAQRIAG